MIMKSLWGSYSKFLSRKHTESLLCPTEFGPNRHEIVFLGHQKRVKDGFFPGLIISSQHKQKCIHNISPDSSAQTSVELESEEIQRIDSDSSKTVHVRFKLLKECVFGQHFLVVGDDPIFGLWEPSDGVPLNWSDGHVWTAEMDIPIGKTIKYKFVLKEDTEIFSWQPGPDRILETWDTEKTITVSEDWDSPELQNIVEEDLVVNEESLVNSDLLIVSEDLNQIPIVDEGNDLIKEELSNANGYVNDCEEKTYAPPMVAENIIEDSSSNEGFNDGIGSNLLDESKVVLDEGVPVLVPGLIPMSPEEINEAVEVDEVDEKNIEESTSIGSDEVEEITEVELEDEHPSASLHSTETGEMMMIDENQQTYDKEQKKDRILETDIQWGRQTLQRFLANFGLQ